MRTALVAAYGPELKPFRANPFFQRVDLHAVGVGIVEAVLGAQKLASYTRIILVGTAGTYNEEVYPVGDPVYATEVTLGAAGAAIPELVGTPRKPSWVPPTPVREQLGIRGCRVVNTLGISSLPHAELAGLGDVEHMEAYAVLRGLPSTVKQVGILLGLTNAVGPDGRRQWRANEAKVMLRVAEAAQAWLTAENSNAP
jgi:hypothetical protein